MLAHDIETLTGYTIRVSPTGEYDITPAMAQYIKESKYKQDLLNHIGLCTNKQLKEKLRRIQNGDIHRKKADTSKNNSIRYSIQDLFTNS